jgi:MFS transporter, ACS family, solute carrier family 17 (sodium-dependent inorganic phosphate cotransporter), other
MAHEFGWSSSIAGLVQSAFFWGYLMSQVPAGYLAKQFTGRIVLPWGVGTWSFFTAAVPIVGNTIPLLCLCRSAVGFGEGVAPSAINDILVKSVPAHARARAVSTTFSGLHIGSIVGFLLAPTLIDSLGWQSVFYVFGALGAVWIAIFKASQGTSIVDKKKLSLWQSFQVLRFETIANVPYRAFLRNRPTQALMATHFANNWFHYTMLAWLPTYFQRTLSLGVGDASIVSLFPALGGLCMSLLAGQLADKLVESGVETQSVRRIAQSIAFLAPMLCLILACFSRGSHVTVLLLTGAFGLNSFSLAGLYCTHQDMSNAYAGPLLGLTNMAGAVPGILGVSFVGLLLDLTENWELALFAPTIAFFFCGTIIYVLFASSAEQDYTNNDPFAFESFLKNE